MAFTRSQAQTKLASTYAKRGGKNLAIPWAQILQILLSLLGGCTPMRAKAWARRNPDALAEMLRGELKSQTSLGTKDIALVASATVDMFRIAGNKDLASLVGA